MKEKSKKANTRKLPKPTLSLLAVAAVFFLLWLCFGITINLRIPAWEFELARERWEASHISDYEMTIQFYSMVYGTNISIVVEDNQIVSMTDLGWLDASPIAIDLSQEPEWYTGTFGYSSSLAPSLQDYEISRLLEFTETVILPAISPEPIIFCERMNRYDVRFNQEFGYIEEISTESCPSSGLLCPNYGHCQAGFRVLEFVP